jgi:streptogramin lyase
MTFRLLAAATATAVSLPVLAGPALADPAPDGQFPVSGVGTNNQIGPGPDGNMWVTLEAVNDLARIAVDGTVTEYNPAAVTTPTGITTGPDGNLWVTQSGGVARFAPGNPNGAVSFAIADISDPRAITSGPDGNLWTASGNKVIKIPPDNPAGFTSYAATGVVGARWIAAGTDGNLWVADFGGQQIVRVTTAGVGTAFPTGGGPQGVTGGADGQVAYSNPTAMPQTIGRIQPPAAAVTTPTPLADPFGVALGGDGSYWFAQFATNNLGRLTADGQYSTLALAAGTGPRQISAGPGNTLWVTLDLAEAVARVNGVSPAPAPAPTPQPTPVPGATVDTRITKKPKKVVRSRKARARVKVRFTGTRGASFQCRLGKKPLKKWRSCASPKVLKLKPGRYTFRVRASLGGIKDRTPAKVKFRVKRRR